MVDITALPPVPPLALATCESLSGPLRLLLRLAMLGLSDGPSAENTTGTKPARLLHMSPLPLPVPVPVLPPTGNACVLDGAGPIAMTAVAADAEAEAEAGTDAAAAATALWVTNEASEELRLRVRDEPLPVLVAPA